MLYKGPIVFNPPAVTYDRSNSRDRLTRRELIEESYPKKLCFCCGILRPSSCYMLSSKTTDGLQVFCNACGNSTQNNAIIRHMASFRVSQAKHKQSHVKKYPMRQRVRNFLSWAIASGRVTPEPCWHCGDHKSEGHHPDYSKPKEVQWLCKICHAVQDKLLRHQKPLLVTKMPIVIPDPQIEAPK